MRTHSAWQQTIQRERQRVDQLQSMNPNGVYGETCVEINQDLKMAKHLVQRSQKWPSITAGNLVLELLVKLLGTLLLTSEHPPAI